MKVAVFGCVHGELNKMFHEVSEHEKRNDVKIDLIIVCGDCQTIRHEDDMSCCALPQKYRFVGDFHEYYSGVRKVPRLTIFVGGNHEASNYLMTLPYGGWVCDNFYYLGFAGVIKYRGLRIGGVSGIYKSENCNKGRFERLPFDGSTVRSIYHTRRLDIFRISLLSKNINKHNQLDVFLSHDWPAKIYEHGNKEELVRKKPHFKDEVYGGAHLGNPMTRTLIPRLKPRRWFAAHLHVKFRAEVKEENSGEILTEFLSLNKIPFPGHAEFIDLEPVNSQEQNYKGSAHEGSEHDDDNLYYDAEWLTILRKTIDLEYKSSNNVPCPNPDDDKGKPYYPTLDEIQETSKLMIETGGLQIKRNFCMTEPVIYNRQGGGPTSIDRNRRIYYPNPQHVDLCTRLAIRDNIADDAGDPHSSTSHVLNEDLDDRSVEARPKKKLAVELDEDGCLPFFIDKKGEP